MGDRCPFCGAPTHGIGMLNNRLYRYSLCGALATSIIALIVELIFKLPTGGGIQAGITAGIGRWNWSRNRNETPTEK